MRDRTLRPGDSGLGFSSAVAAAQGRWAVLQSHRQTTRASVRRLSPTPTGWHLAY